MQTMKPKRLQKSHQPFHKKLHELNQGLLSRLDILVEEIKHLQQGSQEFAEAQEEDRGVPQLQARWQQLLSQGLEVQNWARKETGRLLREHEGLVSQFEEINSRGCYFKTLYETGLVLAAEPELEKLLEFVMESAIEMTGARRGFVALVDEKGNLTFIVARNIDKEKISDPASEVSRDIINAVLCSCEPIKLDDAASDNAFKNKNSVRQLHLRSVVSVPLKSNGEILGVIYLDNPERQECFGQDSLYLLVEFANQISEKVKRTLEYKSIKDAHTQLMDRLRESHKFSGIVGKSPELRTVLETIAQIADTQAYVLIQGESGTGKELIAKAIHFNSSRRDHPFIVVNAGAIPETLLESELFGYEKGAFTGATGAKPGKFELATGGTLFLDEIGDMSPSLQGKILRAIQNQEIERLGGTKVIPVNVRIVAATNKDLHALMKQGKFRQELYYRLNIVNICLPPLRERKEDIALLANYFLKHYAARERQDVQRISLQALQVLETYNWPGNVRELENVIERAVILCRGKEIGLAHLPREIVGVALPTTKRHHDFTEAVTEFKKLLVLRTLQETGNNKAEAARRLHLNRTYFFSLLKKLGIG